MRKYKIFSLLCILIFLTSCSCRCEYFYEEIPPEPEIPRLVYVALGDSVSEGFGIWSVADRHTAVFFEMLREEGYANEYVNHAVSGFTTTDLLELLDGLDEYELEAMYYATVVTLNIGGNNILAPLLRHLPASTEIERITDETLAFATAAWELAMEIMEFAGEAGETVEEILEFANEVIYFVENFGFFDIFRITGVVNAAAPVIDGASEIFGDVSVLEAAVMQMLAEATELEVFDLLALLSGNFPDELVEGFEESIREFSYEFIEILEWLETHAPNAVVIANTVYNPLPVDFVDLPIGFFDESQRLILEINYIIYAESTARGVIVSDVHSDLSYRPDMMNFSFDIIHPNPDGHYAIARLNFADFMARE